MALPTSGPLSQADIRNEFSGPTTMSLSEYYKNGIYVTSSATAPNVPVSGEISISDFYGASAAPTTPTVCITVVDECSVNQTIMNTNWNDYKTARPTTPMYLLQPSQSGVLNPSVLKIPPTYTSANLGLGPILVNRDNGDVAQRSDWFTLCGLGSYPQGTTVIYSIDDSGSMRISTVQASLDFFIQSCAIAGFVTEERTMTGENWIQPFVAI